MGNLGVAQRKMGPIWGSGMGDGAGAGGTTRAWISTPTTMLPSETAGKFGILVLPPLPAGRALEMPAQPEPLIADAGPRPLRQRLESVGTPRRSPASRRGPGSRSSRRGRRGARCASGCRPSRCGRGGGLAEFLAGHHGLAILPRQGRRVGEDECVVQAHGDDDAAPNRKMNLLVCGSITPSRLIPRSVPVSASRGASPVRGRGRPPARPGPPARPRRGSARVQDGTRAPARRSPYRRARRGLTRAGGSPACPPGVRFSRRTTRVPAR